MEFPRLLDLFELAEPDRDRFLGRTQPLPEKRLFGGLLLAQAVAAAGRTVAADRPVHSMHALFVRAADPTDLVEYTVERIR
ncbi:thioesterase family protein, partial [Klebsiella pneumoniae]|nr:thioesterase family protein [Klebsiella pneumoniae]